MGATRQATTRKLLKPACFVGCAQTLHDAIPTIGKINLFSQHGHSLSVQNIDFYLPSAPFCHHFIQEQDTCLSSRPSKKYITLLKLTTELKTSYHLFLELKINIFELFELLVICSRVKPVSTRFKVVTA